MRLERRVPKFFTYKQVAEILNIPVCEVQELIAEGLLNQTKFLTLDLPSPSTFILVFIEAHSSFGKQSHVC